MHTELERKLNLLVVWLHAAVRPQIYTTTRGMSSVGLRALSNLFWVDVEKKGELGLERTEKSKKRVASQRASDLQMRATEECRMVQQTCRFCV